VIIWWSISAAAIAEKSKGGLYAETAIGWTEKLHINELSFTTATHFSKYYLKILMLEDRHSHIIL
jgi:hypothetical protein